MKKKKDIPFFNAANIISITRVLLLPVFLIFLTYGNTTLKKSAIILCIIIFLADYLDGWVARKFNLKTKIGSYLDVVADRITELFLWLTFLSLDLIPLWAPIIVISRSMITDFIRAKALMNKKGTYDMIETDTGKFLVSSRIVRGLYAGLKMLLFTLLTASITTHTQEILTITPTLVTTIVIMSILRGIPVIHEGIKYMK